MRADDGAGAEALARRGPTIRPETETRPRAEKRRSVWLRWLLVGLGGRRVYILYMRLCVCWYIYDRMQR
jgi:hypothetical protein